MNPDVHSLQIPVLVEHWVACPRCICTNDFCHIKDFFGSLEQLKRRVLKSSVA